ncbi:secretin N-terminal domain-containing protein [Planctomycetaceae bacterium SH139]
MTPFCRLLLVACSLACCCFTNPTTAAAQAPGNTDLARLAHPEVADELALDDQQRAKIQALLQRRAEVIAANPENQAEQLATIETELRGVLNEQQLAQWNSQATTTGNLRFQFREQAWADVLQWFAEQEGLTLVMNQSPPGTFTYTDNRSYTSAEAIDLLNSVLLTRGFTLLRREKMLTLLQLSSTIPIELIPRVKLEELPARGKFELISVLFPLGARPVDAVIREVEPYLGTFGRAIPLPQSKQLLVIETAGKMQTINVLINTVPEPKQPAQPKPAEKPPQPVFAAYPLGELDPQTVLETIKGLIGSDRITVDDKTRLLTAFVIPGQQTAIQTFIEAMRQGVGEAPGESSKAYRLEGGNAEQIREQIAALAPRATVSIDDAGERLFVTGSQTDQQQIAAALQAMGIDEADADAEVRAFQVDAAQTTTLTTALQAMMPQAQVVGNPTLGTIVVRGSAADVQLADQVIQRLQSEELLQTPVLKTFPLERKATAEWLANVSKVVPQAEFWLDAEGRRLLMLSTAEQQARLEQLLPELLTTLPRPQDRRLETIELSAEQLARWQQLETTVTAQWPELKLVMRPVEADGSAELWLWATAEEQQQIAEVLQQLKANTPEQAVKWPQSYELEGRDRGLVVELVEAEFPEVRISASDPPNRLTVWAEQTVHADLAQLMNEVASRLPATPQPELRSYQVDGMKATALQAVLSPIATAANKANGPTPTLTVDPSDRRLLVSANEAVHLALEEMVEELQQPLAAEDELIFLPYTLTHADAADAKLLLDQAISGITTVADRSGRQLIATATLAQHGRIKAILNELDRPAAVEREMEMRAYELRTLSPTAVLPALQTMWPRMTLSVDATTNQLLASGSGIDHEAFKQAIERLNRAPDDEPLRVETYQVPAGDLTTLPTVLTQLAPKALISTDVANRLVVVWANASQHKRIAAAIEQLRKAASDRNEISIYRVRPAEAISVRTNLVTLFPAASVSADATTGQLTVLATKTLQTEIAEVVSKLTEASESAERPQPKRYAVDKAIRTPLTSLLTSTIPTASVIASSSDAEGMMILATAADHQRVQQLIEQLQAETVPEVERSVAAYDLQDVAPTAFQAVLSERLPQVQVLSGVGTSRLVIAATSEEHPQIEAMIKELAAAFSKTQQGVLRVYQVRADLLTQASSGLATVVPRGVLLPNNGNLEQLTVVATAAEHDKLAAWLAELEQQVAEPIRPVSRVYPLKNALPTTALPILQTLIPTATFVASPAGDSIAVTAREKDHARVVEFLKEFDQKFDKGVTTKSYVLENGNVYSLTIALTTSFPAAKISADTTNNSLIVSASEEDHKAIADVISQQSEALEKGLQTQSYVLKNGSVATLQTALVASFPKATFSADTINNALIVSASEKDHKAIAAVITQQSEALGQGLSTKSYVLENGSVATLQTALAASFPKATFSADTINNALIVAASEQDHVAIAEVIAQQSEALGQGLTTKSYVLENGSVATLRLALVASFPKATFSADTINNALIVSANEKDHVAIAEVIAQQDEALRRGETLKVYVLKHTTPTVALPVLQALIPKAKYAASPGGDALAVTAKPDDHQEIAEFLTQFDVLRESQDETRVFELLTGDAISMARAVGLMAPTASVTAEAAGNRLIVSAPLQEMARVAKVIEQIEERSARGLATETYVLEEGSAATLSVALKASFPQATIAADATNNVLIVSAREQDQQAIAAVVEQQNQAPGRGEELQIYPLEHTDSTLVAEVVENAFGRRSGVGVSADPDSGTVFVVGLPKQQKIAKQLIEQLDRPENGKTQRKLGAYSLQGVDGSDVAESVESLFARARPEVEVRFDFLNDQLVVIATDEQMQLVEETLAQFKLPQRQLEIMPINENDPRAVEDAITALFEDVPYNEKPSVTVDEDRAQLLIRATEEQFREIKELFARLGETGAATGRAASRPLGGNVRNVPVGRDSERLLKRIRDVWPQLRDNPLKVIEPEPSNSPADADAAPAPAGPAPAAPAGPAAAGPAPAGPAAAGPAAAPAAQAPALLRETLTTAVVPAAALVEDEPAGEQRGGADIQQPAIVIVPGEGRWTIASEDREALDMLQKLLEVAVTPAVLPVATSGNNTIYVLQHADAETLATLLTSLFVQARRSRQTVDVDVGTKIVADTRINALVVQATRSTRGVIEGLLAVLDSPEFVDSLRSAIPQLIPIRNSGAERVEALLRTVYSRQLSASSGRPQITIPEGVSDEVATLLEQLNAEAAGPLLTLSIDTISNSIIMRAPPELSKEIQTFIADVDQQAAMNRAERMQIIRLKEGNADRMGEVLQLLKSGR